MPGKLDSFKALSAQDKRHAVVNWLLDHAMIIIILLLAVYVQIQRPQFFGVPSLVNIISLTAARLPMALGVAGCIVLAGTDLTGGRVAGLTAFVAAILLQKAGANGRFIADGVPQNLLLVVLLVMVIGACIGFVNGFVMAKWKLHPYIITLAMQMITYGIYLTVSNSKQVSSLDPSYTTNFVTKSFVKFGTTSVPMYVVLAIFVTAIMWVVWNKTTFGKNMFAVGSNEEAARVSGVNVMATIIGVFMLAGALYGYTGFVEAARLGSSTATLGLNYEADAISAAVGLTSPERTFCRVPGTASSAASSPRAKCSAFFTKVLPTLFSAATFMQVFSPPIRCRAAAPDFAAGLFRSPPLAHFSASYCFPIRYFFCSGVRLRRPSWFLQIQMIAS